MANTAAENALPGKNVQQDTAPSANQPNRREKVARKTANVMAALPSMSPKQAKWLVWIASTAIWILALASTHGNPMHNYLLCFIAPGICTYFCAKRAEAAYKRPNVTTLVGLTLFGGLLATVLIVSIIIAAI